MDKVLAAQVVGVLAMGCIVVAMGAWTLALVGSAKWRRWLGTVTSSCVLAAMVGVGVSTLLAIPPAQAAQWDHWLRGGERPLSGPAFWCAVLALGGVGIAVGASLAAIYSASDWGMRFRSAASYARLSVLVLLLASVVLWNLG